ncbi:MAG TPA: metallophosphoesterase [Acidimicrobiia bacterium]|jgi:hypothetical protein
MHRVLHRVVMRRGVFRRALAGGVVASLGAVVLAACGPAPQLTRYPYLTDLVGTSVIVNWATDQSATTGSAKWGAVDGSGNCNPTNSVTATKTGFQVAGTNEYQWKAKLSLGTTATFCYRVFLGSNDLLGTDSSPQFKAQVPVGSTQPFSFAVFGDWGQVDANGNNPDQANLMNQIAASGARFAVTVGDNAYNDGSQTNYGDLQHTGAGSSAVFGNQFWKVAGLSIPAFPAMGNHGFSRSDTNHPALLNWPQDNAVSSSGGKYTKETYCCVNGTSSASYPSAWYAFSAGTARFYVIEATWADGNVGTSTAYGDDYAAHWTTSSPEYQWLKADLAAHSGGLKFAFFHYPIYSNNATETSDTFLQGANSLEGLLGSNGVQIAFSGHAHIYERNLKQTGGLITYVTGGGGATLEPVSSCKSFDAYAIGWSSSGGSRCGAAPVPDAITRVFHFLKVTVNGSRVTVTPTDELGRTFDVQTFSF